MVIILGRSIVPIWSECCRMGALVSHAPVAAIHSSIDSAILYALVKSITMHGIVVQGTAAVILSIAITHAYVNKKPYAYMGVSVSSSIVVPGVAIE